MTDLEITKLCAEAMGLEYHSAELANGQKVIFYDPYDTHHWNPLHDDAQAMALVKSHTLDITWGPGEQRWRVGEFRFGSEQGMNGKDGLFCEVRSTDLNRAICECVAKLQEASYAPK